MDSTVFGANDNNFHHFEEVMEEDSSPRLGRI